MFDLRNRQTNVRREIVGGLTTFLTMAYIIIVNPIILADAGVPFDQSFTATIIATIIGTLTMALSSNLPIAVAPAMGLNAYFAYSVVNTEAGIDYKVAFAAVFVSGIIFLLLSLTPFRVKLIDAIPHNLKHAIAAGIGLFIAFIGLRLSKIIVSHPTNYVALGDLRDPAVALTLIGFLITIILMGLNVNGALFIGMFITGAIAFFTGQLSFKEQIVSIPHLPDGVIVWNPLEAIALVAEYGLYGVVFTYVLITIFDTTGTMLGVAQQAGVMKDGKLPKAGRAVFSDSLATAIGSMFGTTPTSAYVESSAGVAAGARTGLSTVIVAGLFLIAAFFSNVVDAISGVAAITAPSLIIVGSFMISHVKHIEWEQFDEALPAFLVILTMPLTSSIATGIALGFVSYPILKIVKGKYRDIHPLAYVIAVLFLFQLIFLPH
ncbi:NCS2 family permease [Priestia taiwanensis]|uniref:Guanine permease n=1 Tax=Priestia taiwanensis TaxID=1347902 RepID=A0A917ATK1_9BACI|nr:NCS2 family permease [Priestia taiwanensis]MBM7363302.1 AGZA family xanthine/uracil permease-like MFS transporter [Priestia taiwanensis]GGE69303.1 guanine permease [Priestia taiwanensis]